MRTTTPLPRWPSTIRSFLAGRTAQLLAMSLMGVACLLTGCEAVYSDLRPEGPEGMQPVIDAAPAQGDAGAEMLPDATKDAAAEAPDDADARPAEAELVGAFEGRGGYDASGTATLRSASGGLELVFSDDFASAAVPGPVVVLTSRDAIGTALRGEDTVLARLDGSSIRGPNTFPVPLDEAPRPTYVFVYCEPFGVETARARLEAP